MEIPLCPNCWSSEIRSSHFRFVDLAWLVMLKLPLRCEECQQRFHASLFFMAKKNRELKLAKLQESAKQPEAGESEIEEQNG